jgi:hypothetical protein
MATALEIRTVMSHLQESVYHVFQDTIWLTVLAQKITLQTVIFKLELIVLNAPADTY